MTRALGIGLFWLGLYAVCVAVALAVVPGVPEAAGFALPALLAAAVAAWLARRHRRGTQLAIAVAAAAVLMLGAMTGVVGRGQTQQQQTAAETPAASIT